MHRPPAELRTDVRVTREGEPGVLVTDPVLGRSVRFKGHEAKMLEALAEGRDPSSVPGEGVGGWPEFRLALERLHLLATPGLDLQLVQAMRSLATAPLPRRPVRSLPISETQARTVPLLFHPDIRYRCTGCGVCCHSFLLGPLRGPDVERLESLRWPQGVHLPVGEQALHYLDDDGEAVPFLRTFDGRCVFQDDDGLCAIHKHFGEDVKPLVCRLFPYVFVRLGQRASSRIAVSVQFESRSLWTGHATAPPLSEDETHIRRLMAELGSVPSLPERVTLHEGRVVSLKTALDLDSKALALLDAAPPDLPFSELARRVVSPVVDLVRGARSRGKGKRRRAGLARVATDKAPQQEFPGLERWVAAQLAWNQEIETGLVPLLPDTLDAQRDLLVALEQRAAGRRPGALGTEGPRAFAKSWLRAAIFGRDAYRSPDLVSGWIRNLLRIAVTALLAGPSGRAWSGDPGLSWSAAAVRSSKLFQIGHSPDRPALWILERVPPASRLDAVVGWLAELEAESA